MGNNTDSYLATIFAESFKREIEADEAIWRTLPFFAATVGLAVAILPPIYRAAITIPGWWRIGAICFVAAALLAFGFAAGWFWQVIKLRDYRYPPLDVDILAYASALEDFHRSGSLSVGLRDEADRDELRAFMNKELAAATTQNRLNNTLKSAARSRVLLAAATGFLFSFGAEATILMQEAFPHKPAAPRTDHGNPTQRHDRATEPDPGEPGGATDPASASNRSRRR